MSDDRGQSYSRRSRISQAEADSLAPGSAVHLGGISSLCRDPHAGQSQRQQVDVRRSVDGLTGREEEILRLVAAGHTSNDIAAGLFISRRTVETHRANIKRKLGFHTVYDAVRYALRRGLLAPDSAALADDAK